MKAREIFGLACSYISEQPSESGELAELAPAWLDVLAAEVLPYENALRRYRGQAELEKAPRVEELEAEIAYSAELCVPAMVYGLAAQLLLDDENDARAQDFRNYYVVALRECLRAHEERTADLY